MIQKKLPNQTHFLHMIAARMSHTLEKHTPARLESWTGFLRSLGRKVSNNCFASIRSSIDLERGKLKIVLINSNAECETLKEVDSSLESHWEEDLSINCLNGINKIKIVGYDCKGIVNLSQNQDMIFKFECGNNLNYL